MFSDNMRRAMFVLAIVGIGFISVVLAQSVPVLALTLLAMFALLLITFLQER